MNVVSNARSDRAPGRNTSEIPEGAPARKRILIVDDDEDAARLMARGLERDYDVVRAKNGAQGLMLALASPHPDVIITDLVMPLVDGITMMNAMRAALKDARPPVIVVTACDESSDVIAGIQAGARHYLTKPVSLDDLERKIARILGGRARSSRAPSRTE